MQAMYSSSCTPFAHEHASTDLNSEALSNHALSGDEFFRRPWTPQVFKERSFTASFFSVSSCFLGPAGR